MTAKTYARDNGADPALVSDYEGQMIIHIDYNQNAAEPLIAAAPVIDGIKRLLDQCGDIKAFHTCTSLQRNSRDIRIEFFDADDVALAKDLLDGASIQVSLSSIYLMS